eukprot:2082160-Prymnesium_polylepis.1
MAARSSACEMVPSPSASSASKAGSSCARDGAARSQLNTQAVGWDARSQRARGGRLRRSRVSGLKCDTRPAHLLSGRRTPPSREGCSGCGAAHGPNRGGFGGPHCQRGPARGARRVAPPSRPPQSRRLPCRPSARR